MVGFAGPVAIALAALVLACPARAACDHILPSDSEAAAPVRPVDAKDLIELRDISSPESWLFPGQSPLALSPDGGSIAFLINRADLAANSYCRALVVIPASGGAPRIVDRGGEYIIVSDVVRGLMAPVGGGAMIVPSWSPDGQWIGYLKREGGVTQLWRARSDGSLAEPVTHSATDIARWAWTTNDGIVFATRVGIAAAERALDTESLSGYHYDGRVMTMNGLRPQLWAKDVPEQGFAIDLATGRIRAPNEVEAERLAMAPSLLGASDTGVRSADGSRAMVEAGSDNPQVPRRIRVVDRAGRNVDCAAEACAGGVVQTWWEPGGSLLFLRREGRADSQMAVYRWRPGSGEPRRLFVSSEWITSCLFDSGRLICSVESSERPARIVSIALDTGASTTLFDPNPGFSRLRLGKVERIFTRNDIGLDAWADLVLPPGYKPGTKLPLVIVQYHSRGFLRGGTGNDYPIFLLAARGFAVLSVERPPMFGLNRPDLDTWDKLIAAMTENWAERRSILSSLLAGVDQAVARGIVHPGRVGITGLSDGMSTIEYGLINTRRFAAAALSSCCEDHHSVMTYGGITWADWNHKVRKYPLASEDGTAFWTPMSLALNARSVNTPILMQLADREYLGGLETFTALREQKNPVDLYVYPDEYHMKWQPRHRLAVYGRAIDWFDFWLNGHEDPSPDKRAQYRSWEAMRAERSAKSSTAS